MTAQDDRTLREVTRSITRNLNEFGYPGTFDDLKDPQAQGRAKICSKLVVNREEALDLWAYPVSPYAGKDKGLIMPPDEGDVARVWFDHGKTDQPHYLGSTGFNDDRDN